MTALIVIAAVLLLFCLLFLLRIRVLLICGDTVKLQIRVLCLRFSVVPRRAIRPRKYSPKYLEKQAKKAVKRKQAKKQKQAKKRAAKTQAGSSIRAEAGHASLSVTEKAELVHKLLASLLRSTRKHLTLRAAKLHVTVATGDAAATAVAYGAVCGTLSGILALLDRVTALHAEPPNVAVRADFLSEKSKIDIRIVFSMRLGGALLSIFSVALEFFRVRRSQKRKKNKKKAASAASSLRKEPHHG